MMNILSSLHRLPPAWCWTLGVREGATVQEIRAAHQMRVMDLHGQGCIAPFGGQWVSYKERKATLDEALERALERFTPEALEAAANKIGIANVPPPADAFFGIDAYRHAVRTQKREEPTEIAAAPEPRPLFEDGWKCPRIDVLPRF